MKWMWVRKCFLVLWWPSFFVDGFASWFGIRSFRHRESSLLLPNIGAVAHDSGPEAAPSAYNQDALDRNGKTSAARKVPTVKQQPSEILREHDSIAVDPHDDEKQQQLWLDLRGMALFPHEAVRFLEKECSDDDNDSDSSRNTRLTVRQLIDKVLVSSQTFDRILERKDRQKGSERHEGDDDGDDQGFDLLYTANDSLIRSSSDTQQSIPVGTIMAHDGDEQQERMLDPLMALDIVMEQRKWLVIDKAPTSPSPGNNVVGWMKKQVSSLLQLCSSPGISSSTSTSSKSMLRDESVSGLVLPSSAQDNNDIMRTGGIAIVCLDKNSFLQLDATLAEFKGTAAGLHETTTTESGLLVPVVGSSTSAGNETLKSFSRPIPSTALILPLDIQVWRTALDIRQLNDEQND